MTSLIRTNCGQFALHDCVAHEDIGNADVMLAAMRSNDGVCVCVCVSLNPKT
jgi:hypothetical protein